MIGPISFITIVVKINLIFIHERLYSFAEKLKRKVFKLEIYLTKLIHQNSQNDWKEEFTQHLNLAKKRSYMCTSNPGVPRPTRPLLQDWIARLVFALLLGFVHSERGEECCPFVYVGLFVDTLFVHEPIFQVFRWAVS